MKLRTLCFSFLLLLMAYTSAHAVCTVPKVWGATEVVTHTDLNNNFAAMAACPPGTTYTSALDMNYYQILHEVWEKLAADPIAGHPGRVWYNTTTKTPKWEDGTSVRLFSDPPTSSYAGLPTCNAAITGSIYWLTDNIRGYWRCNGTAWASLSGVANILDFGGDPTASASSQGAWESARDAAAAVPCATVRFPVGSFLVTGMTVSDQCVDIEGAGGHWYPGTTRIISTTNAPILKYTMADHTVGPLHDVNNRSVKGLELFGTTTSGTSQHCLQIDNRGLRGEDLTGAYCGGDGVLMTDSVGSILTNVFTYANKGNGRHIEPTDGTTPNNSNVSYSSTSSANQGDGLHINASWGNTEFHPILGDGNLGYGVYAGSAGGLGFGNRIYGGYNQSNTAGTVAFDAETMNNNFDFAVIDKTIAIVDAGAGTNNNIVSGTDSGLGTHLALGQGAMLSVPWVAGNFTGSGAMTWTVEVGDQGDFHYSVVGKTMTMWFYLSTTTVGGTPDTVLYILIPGGFIPAITTKALIEVLDNSSAKTGSAVAAIGVNRIAVYNAVSGGTNWTASTNATAVRGQITFAVQ